MDSTTQSPPLCRGRRGVGADALGRGRFSAQAGQRSVAPRRATPVPVGRGARGRGRAAVARGDPNGAQFSSDSLAEEPAGGRHSCRSVQRQRVLSRREPFRPYRLLLRLQRRLRIRSGDLPQRLVFRARRRLQRVKGAGDDLRLRAAAAAWRGRGRRAAAPGSGGRAAIHAAPAGGLAQRAAGRKGRAEESTGIPGQIALPPTREVGRRLRSHAVSQRVSIWTDGACSGNPGPGGWGAVLRYGDHEKELKGGEALTTNNRMELTAAIEALSSLKRSCEVILHTDS